MERSSATGARALKVFRIERSREFGFYILALAPRRGAGLEALCERLLPMVTGALRGRWPPR